MKYRKAGVDLDKAALLVEKIKRATESTRRDEWLDALGGFGGLFRMDLSRHRKPVLVSSTDGVGTKLRLAFALNRHRGIGIDLVAMCVNDILAQGAEPLFFLDYLAMGSLEVEVAVEVVEGIAEGCRRAGCSLVGGETAEMPGFYPAGEYEVAGFAVGVVDEDRIVTGKAVTPGDSVIGLASNGVHSNGFSLVRSILGDDLPAALEREAPWGGVTLGEELLKPTAIYVKNIQPLLEKDIVHGLAHITGGGLVDNLLRILPPETGADLTPSAWPVPPVFQFIQEAGQVEDEEMRRVFNMGLGYLMVVAEGLEDEALSMIEKSGCRSYRVGEVTGGPHQVRFVG
jgi:phosphoribosylformylglycinamidine cyclo-ligase